ncbi:Druantia anti-phage system protein DruA [Acidithrix sp. C25]|uniref:Druantia anti-phage system protein DruA n=1 Tax=Acidithrix sp. C25 TaxID=1671482 RepID=UPI00191BB021|nr:Druantia anti-phage system protein DruA [Acidithrix sp. C25]
MSCPSAFDDSSVVLNVPQTSLTGGWVNLMLLATKKDMSARVALLRMDRDRLITLPKPLHGNGNGLITRYAKPIAELPFAYPESLDDLCPIKFAIANTKAQKQRWRNLIASYHYLGYTTFAGAEGRYLIESSSGTIGAIGFAASPWSCAPRDNYIGWDKATREARLHLVVGNARFLILPQVRVVNLASYILSRVARRLPGDWQLAYGYQPVLLETFVESARFTEASYKAANWIRVGQTKGRGKLDRYNQYALSVKEVYLYPLHRNYRSILASPE